MDWINVEGLPVKKLKDSAKTIVIKHQDDFEKLILHTDSPVFFDDEKAYSDTKNGTIVFFYNGRNLQEMINKLGSDVNDNSKRNSKKQFCRV